MRCCLMQCSVLEFGPISLPTFPTEVFPQYLGVLEVRTASILSSGLEMDEEFSETSVSYYPITWRHIIE